MAPSAGRFQISSRSSSALDYPTATGVSFDHVLHSTPQMENTATQQSLRYNHFSHPDPSEHGSDRTADMSIELGRGGKNRARDHTLDMSSDAAISFSMGNSQYEITTTPPARARTASARKDDAFLRREASVRRANDAVHAHAGQKRSLSGPNPRGPSGTHRSSRFSPMPSASAPDPGYPVNQRPTGFANTTVHSTTYTTNHSFILPDMPNITEMVSGVRADGTPVFNRNAAARSRFTSASYRPSAQGHRTVSGVAIPDDEKAIFASLQLMKDRVSQVDMEKTDAQVQAEAKGDRVADLTGHTRRTEHTQETFLSDDVHETKTKQPDNMAWLQERLAESERELGVMSSTLEQVTKERDGLVVQISSAYINHEQLLEENEMLRDSQHRLQAENDELRSQLERLRAKYEQKKSQRTTAAGETKIAQTGAASENTTAKAQGATENGIRSRKEGRAPRRRPSEQVNREEGDDIASRIEQEVKRQREATEARKASATSGIQSSGTRAAGSRSRSRSQQRTQATASFKADHLPSRHASAPAELVSDAESTTNLDWTKSSRRSKTQKPENVAPQASLDESKDITYLSEPDLEAFAALRKKLEEELRAKRHRKSASASEQPEATVANALPRKSSLKDITAALSDGTGRFSLGGRDGEDTTKLAKTVRVQSPHTSDEISHDLDHTDNEATNVSILSNISRRRRRPASTDGDTSAFIIPDITIQQRAQSLPADLEATCVKHNAAECTMCVPAGKAVPMPTPVPVTDREGLEDLTNATIRPSQPPAQALGMVIKNLEDEIRHLKMEREKFNRAYTQHDPALSRRKRQSVKASIDKLTAEVEKRSDQIYALYDVLEGQKEQANATGKQPQAMNEEEVEETLTSIGIDPAELSGQVGRKAPAGLEGIDDVSDDDDLPWEGLSDGESEFDFNLAGMEKRGDA